MASTSYHMLIELPATSSNSPSTSAPRLKGETPVLPCCTAGFHHFTSPLPLSQHLQGIQGLRPFLYSSHNVLDTVGHAGSDQTGESAAMPVKRTLWSAQQCTPHAGSSQSPIPDSLGPPPRASRGASTSATSPALSPLLLRPPVNVVARAPAARFGHSSASHARAPLTLPRSSSHLYWT